MKKFVNARHVQFLTASAIAAAPMLAGAAQGEVCSTAPKPFSAGSLNDDTSFQCKSIGTVTIPQLYQKGWRVISVMPQMMVNPANPMDQKASWTVVIEKT